MQYTYEFEMWRGEFAWIAAPFDLVGITQGVDGQEVVVGCDEVSSFR